MVNALNGRSVRIQRPMTTDTTVVLTIVMVNSQKPLEFPAQQKIIHRAVNTLVHRARASGWRAVSVVPVHPLATLVPLLRLKA
jgi:hypothetical protein